MKQAKEFFLRRIAVVLAILMVAVLLPAGTPAMATETVPQEETSELATAAPKAETAMPMGTTADGLEYYVYSDYVVITDYTGRAASLVIPDEIEGLPVTSIGPYAFEGCSSLTSIEIPSGVTSIEHYAFEGCSSLTSIEIPSGVTSIGHWGTFRGCSSLISIKIPSGVTYIGVSAFEDCSSLTSINIPSGVAGIGHYAFRGCSNLTSIEVDRNNNTYASQQGVLYNKDMTELITCPEGKQGSVVIPSGVTSIRSFAFYGCSSLISINIPSSVTKIDYIGGDTDSGGHAFIGCSSLISIEVDSNNSTYASLQGILYSKDMTKLITCPGSKQGSIEIPGSVTYILYSAFEGCSSLTSINIPSGVTYIGSSAFQDCTSLTSINIPSGVTEISDYAFAGCTSLTSINIPGSVTRIEPGTFYGCSSLTSIDIPNSVTSIDGPCNFSGYYGAFEGCSSLTGIVLPDNTEYIDWKTFCGCSSLSEITIPESVTTIVYESFTGCDSLSDVYYGGSKSGWDAISIGHSNEDLTNATIHYAKVDNDPIIEDEFAYCCDMLSDLFAGKDAGPIELKYPFYYDDSWFLGSAKVYNHQLAQMSIRAAMAAFNSNTPEAKGDNAYYIKKLMDQLGYTYDSNFVSYPKPNHFTIGYAIGSKNISDDTSVLMVAVRGAGYEGEWYSNAIVGESGDHLGFDEASHQVGDGIYAYINAHRSELRENIKVWMVGYSRAAATVNLAAADLCDGFIAGISPEDVFAYCFECPQGTTDPNAATSKYSSIKNIVNPIDFVTKVAMCNWNFTRYGVTYYMPFEGGSVDHIEPKKEMQAQYDAFLRYNGLTNDTKRINAVLSLTAESTAQAIAFRDITSLAADFIGSRKTYATTLLQSDIAALADGLLGGGLNDAEILDGLIPGVLSLIVAKDTIKDAAENPLVVLDMMDHIKTVLDMNPDAISELGSMSNLMTAHYPELCLSWLDSLDGNYKSYNGNYVKIIVNCPVDIAVYDDQGNMVAQIVEDTAVEIENGMPSYMDMDGQKVIILPDEANYDILLTATGNGTMTYTVEQCDLELKDSSYIVSYCDIPIESDDVLSATVSKDSVYELYDTDNNLIEPSLEMENEIQYCSIDVFASGHGEVSAVPVKVKSEFVKVTAEPWEQDNFLGWYNGDILVSQNEVYRFRVEDDVSLTAKFTTEHHRFGAWVLVQKPTVTEHGREERSCACGAVESRLTEKLYWECPFDDVTSSDYYYASVRWAVDEGITTGITPTEFSPYDSCLRSQVVTFLWRAAGEPKAESKVNPFVDVKPGDYYYDAVLWAVEKGITTGADATHFEPNGVCNRSQVVTFLYRAFEKPPVDSEANPFTDVSTGDWYASAVLWAVKEGITNGLSETEFGPNDACNRSQVVTFLYRAYN